MSADRSEMEQFVEWLVAPGWNLIEVWQEGDGPWCDSFYRAVAQDGAAVAGCMCGPASRVQALEQIRSDLSWTPAEKARGWRRGRA